MTSQGDNTSFWIKFFTEAGIPAGEAANYAVTFTDNRIQRDMLLDLNKEYLNDMGITMMGDIISILKHAKVISAQDSAQAKAQRAASFSPQVTMTPPRRSTPASRTIAHYLKTDSDPDAVPMNVVAPPPLRVTDKLAGRLGPSPASTPPRTDSPRLEGRISGSNVFARLGNDGSPSSSRSSSPVNFSSLTAKLEAAKYESKYGSAVDRKKATPTQTKVTVTGLGKMVISSSTVEEQSVFKRLGAAVKRPATSTTTDFESEDKPDDACEYAGVLQPERVKKPKVVQPQGTVAKPVGTSVHNRLGPVSSIPKATEGILSLESEFSSVLLKKDNTKVSSTTTNKSAGILSRLGPQPQDVSSSADVKPKMIKTVKTTTNEKQKGVFERLGKQINS